jgi:hypothetical protein
MNDRGSQFPSDAADSAPGLPTRNRGQIDYVIPAARRAREYIRSLTRTNSGVTVEATEILMMADMNDFVIGRRIGDSTNTVLVIAKPHELRVSQWNEQTINGVKYLYQGPGRRISRKGLEIIYPNYVPNVTVLYCLPIPGGSDMDGTRAGYIDLNVDGRSWRQLRATQRCKVLSIEDNYLVCKMLDDANLLVGDEIKVYKPFELMRDTWDTQTINGFTYTWVGTQTRQSARASDPTDIEVQIITPPYVANQTIIEVALSIDGTIARDVTPGRGWSQESGS